MDITTATDANGPRPNQQRKASQRDNNNVKPPLSSDGLVTSGEHPDDNDDELLLPIPEPDECPYCGDKLDDASTHTCEI